MSDSVRPHRRQPTRLCRPWDSPGKNTGVGCHFLLQCKKVKSESEVTQLCLTLRNPMDCSSPGSSLQGIFQARVLEWGAIAFSASTYYPSPIKFMPICQPVKITYGLTVPRLEGLDRSEMLHPITPCFSSSHWEIQGCELFFLGK